MPSARQATPPLPSASAPAGGRPALAAVGGGAEARREAPAAASPLEAAALVAVLDQLDTGVIVCSAEARVLLANEAARRELTQAQVLMRQIDGRLMTADGASLASLRQAINQAVAGGRRQLLRLHHQGASLMVAVQPLRESGQPAAVLLLGRRKLCPDLVVEMLGTLHELTLAERRVLNGLLAGKQVAMLAQEHGVAVSTVRTQAASLRAKFGVRRLEDLARLAAEMPPMASALRTPMPSVAPACAAPAAEAAPDAPRLAAVASAPPSPRPAAPARLAPPKPMPLTLNSLSAPAGSAALLPPRRSAPWISL